MPIQLTADTSASVRCAGFMVIMSPTGLFMSKLCDIQEGEVRVLECFDCKGRATIGELVTKVYTLYRGAVAIASNAPLRDGNDLIKQNYPVWCSNLTPVGSFNRKLDEPLDPEIEKRQRAKI